MPIVDFAAGAAASEGLRAHLRVQVRGDTSNRADVAELLTRVCLVAVSEVGFDGAGVHLVSSTKSGVMEHEVVAASSDERARAVDELEMGLGEGPAHEAMTMRRPVLSGDLSQEAGRWPGYVSAALEAGIGAVFAFPLHVGAVKLGVLTTHCGSPKALTGPEVTAMLALADLATEILLDGHLPGAAGPQGPGFLAELELRDEVYQAQGMVSVDLGVSLREAAALLRAHAFSRGGTLRDVALDVVAGRTRLSEYDQAPAPDDSQ